MKKPVKKPQPLRDQLWCECECANYRSAPMSGVVPPNCHMPKWKDIQAKGRNRFYAAMDSMRGVFCLSSGKTQAMSPGRSKFFATYGIFNASFTRRCALTISVRAASMRAGSGIPRLEVGSRSAICF